MTRRQKIVWENFSKVILLNAWLPTFLLLSLSVSSQNFTGVYKTDQLIKRISHPDTAYVVNFWATWCKPCIEELPAFDSLYLLKKSLPVKVLLVSLDFKEELEKKVKPFLHNRKIKAECVLLDEVNGNDFIDKIYPQWSGAIPATLFRKGSQQKFMEKKMKLAELLAQLESLK